MIKKHDEKSIFNLLLTMDIIPNRDEIKNKMVYQASEDDDNLKAAVIPIPIAAGAWVYVVAATQVALAVAYVAFAGIKVKMSGPKSEFKFQTPVIYPKAERTLEVIAENADVEFAREIDRKIIDYINNTIKDIAMNDATSPFSGKMDLQLKFL